MINKLAIQLREMQDLSEHWEAKIRMSPLSPWDGICYITYRSSMASLLHLHRLTRMLFHLSFPF